MITMLKNFFTVILIGVLMSSNTVKSLESQWQGTDEVKLRLISPIKNTDKKDELIVGLEYALSEGWKTYWKSPGAGGFSQTIKYENSENIENIEILWPTPIPFSILGLNSLGYQNEVVFPVRTKIIDAYEPLNFNLDIHLLVCKDICIPVDVNLELMIPSGQKAEFTEHLNIIEKFVSLSPLQSAQTFDLMIDQVILHKVDDNSILEIEIEKNDPFTNPQIFIDNDMGLPVVLPQIEFNENKKRLNAKFFYEDAHFDLENNYLNIHLSDSPIVYEQIVEFKLKEDSDSIFNNYKFINIVFISLLAGLILNLMPCVLPILSLKLISVIKFTGSEKKLIRRGFISISLGILSSYMLLALVMLALRYSGHQVGWGIQFQQPMFLMFISVVLLFFSLNLFDLFQIKNLNLNTLNKSNDKNNLTTEFFYGFFATLMATPCSAPFVGTAITFAFTQEAIILLTVFFLMGFGMATPYFVVSIFPSTINFLPKPGSWMIWVKRIMALLLLATLIWVYSILANHFNSLFIFISLILAVVVFLLMVLNFFKKIPKGTFALSVLFIICFYFFLPSIMNFYKFSSSSNDNWVEFNEDQIETMLGEDKIIFVDITADWCVTCQYNKRNVINTKEIQELFQKNGIIQVKGDWTLPDQKIEIFLNRYNKFGIPFNIMYSKSKPEGVVFSELLTKKSIKQAVDRVKNNK